MKYVLVIATIALSLIISGPAKANRINASGNQSLEKYRRELLDLAFAGVSDMPLRPHIKNRSRAQLKVVDTYLELGQTERALYCIEQIENWQRWMGYANLAACYLEQNSPEQSKELVARIEIALKAADEFHSGKISGGVPDSKIETLKDWRREAVLARIAGITLSDQAVESFNSEEMQFDEMNAANLKAAIAMEKATGVSDALAGLREIADSQNFEVASHGLIKMGELVAAYYDEVGLLQLISEEVEPRVTHTPVFLRLKIYFTFAQAAVDNNDLSSARSIFGKLEGMVAKLKLQPDFYLLEAVKLYGLQYKMGDAETARKRLDELAAFYGGVRESIVNINRSELLCRMAELYHELGAASESLDLYRRAVNEGQVNPNSRPQADDLSRVCCSMAMKGIEPDHALWAQLRSMRSRLGNPW